MIKIPIKYLPKNLTAKNKRQQFKMLMKSEKLYKKQIAVCDNYIIV